jgi:hypothetical protein
MTLTSATKGNTNAPTLDLFRNTTRAYAFYEAIAGQENELFSTLQMSHTYKLGTNISCHMHWTCGTTNTTANVTWAIEVSKSDLYYVFPASTTYKKSQVCGVAYNETLTDFGSIGTFNGVSGIGVFRIFRNSANVTDTYAGNDVFGLSLDCHYQKDSPGSRTEYLK